MGRPCVDKETLKEKVFTVRLTEEEFQQLTDDAEALGLTRAEYFRLCWRKASKNGWNKEKAAKIRKISSLVQQLGRAADFLRGDL